MKKRAFVSLLVMMMVTLAFTLVGCKDDPQEPPVTTYAVTYSAGEGTGTPPSGNSYAEGATFALPQATNLTKEGSHFTTWNDGTADYAAGATYTMPAKAVTFTAQWEEDQPATTYTVTFNPNNADTPVTWTEQVADGGKVAKPDDPTIESGKLFRYWATEDGSEYSFDTPVTANLELTAVYAYKVTFAAGEGTGTVDPMWVKVWTPAGIKLPDGTNLTHSGGKLFGGWNDGTATYQAGESYKGTGNHTLTAVWKDPVTDITVSFETTYYGEGDAPASQSKHVGDKVTLPENTFTAKADYSGYVFAGWYVKGGSNSELYQPGDTYTISSDFSGESLVFMAKWEKGSEPTPVTTYTVTYKSGDHASGADIVQNNVAGGNIYLLKVVTAFTPETNYYFSGWKKEGDATNKVYTTDEEYALNENTVFVAQWAHIYSAYDNLDLKQATATIMLYLDSNTGYLYDFEKDNLIALTIALTGTEIAITPNGGAASTGTFENDELTIKLTYGGKTYRFGNITYTVTFNPNNADTPVTWTEKVTEGSTVAKPATDPTIESGKLFRYWTTEDGEEYSFDTPVTENLELTAEYAYKVTFAAGEGTGTVEPIWKKSWPFMGIELPDGTGLTHSGGKYFSGWSDGTTTYKAGELYTTKGNPTLTAVWKEPATNITVSFETTRYGEGTAPESQTGKSAGGTVTLPENTFTVKANYSYYVFAGWYVSGNSATLYQPSDTYNIPADYTDETLVFMAKWEKGKFTVTYKPGDHATGADIVQQDVTGGNIYLSSDLTGFTIDNFYSFVGWQKEGGTEEDVYAAGSKYVLGENTVFIAQWSHEYVGYDNIDLEQASAAIQLLFDLNIGYLIDFTQEDPIDLTFTLSGTTITITPDGGTACTGTFENNVLSIALTYNGTTYIFGTPEVPISFEATDGGEGNAPASITGKYAGDTITLPDNTFTSTLDGYAFAGWYVSGNSATLYHPGDTYTIPSDFSGVSLVFTAKWEKQYTVTYKPGDHASGDNIVKNVLGENTVLLTAEEVTFTPETNYVFNGWKKEGGTESYTAGASYTLSEDTVFVAQWLHEPTIRFGAGGGSGTAPTATATYNSTSQKYEIELPGNTYTAPTGKEFKCWSIGGAEYQAGATYTAEEGEVVTIIAVWQGGVSADCGSVQYGEYTEAGMKVGPVAGATTNGFSVSFQLSNNAAEWGSNVITPLGDNGESTNAHIAIATLDPWNGTLEGLNGINAFPGIATTYNGVASTVFQNTTSIVTITVSASTGITYYKDGVKVINYAYTGTFGDNTTQIGLFVDAVLEKVEKNGFLFASGDAVGEVANLTVYSAALSYAEAAVEYSVVYAELKPEEIGGELGNDKLESVPFGDNWVNVDPIAKGTKVTFSGTQKSAMAQNYHTMLFEFSDNAHWTQRMDNFGWTFGAGELKSVSMIPSATDAEGKVAVDWVAAFIEIAKDCTWTLTINFEDNGTITATLIALGANGGTYTDVCVFNFGEGAVPDYIGIHFTAEASHVTVDTRITEFAEQPE